MKHFLLSFLLLVASAGAQQQSPASANPVDLDQAFQEALARSERFAIQSELITQAEQQYAQARGGVLPNVAFRTTFLKQDPTSAGNAATSRFAQSEQTTVRLTLAQPLFQGLREFAALRAAGALERSATLEKDRARILLYTDVANVFFTVLSLENDLENIETILKLTDQRRNEVAGFRRIGRSRPSELLAVETQLKTLKAEQAVVQGNLAAAREAFVLLTGLPRETKLNESTPSQQPLAPLPDYLSLVPHRPDIKAALERTDAAENSITIARAGHWPTLDLSGNYYFKRPGIISETKWDITLDFVFPIFTGGTVVAGTRLAASQYRQASLEVSRLRREADTEVARLYQSVAALGNQVRALSDALNFAEKNYQTQNREYRLGLVTNIDVIQALNSYQETKRAFDRARFDERSGRIALEAAVARGVPEPKK